MIASKEVGKDIFLVTLAGCQALVGCKPGQFVMLHGDWGRDPLLPRAFSILSVRPNGELALLVKAAGRATTLLSRAKIGEVFSVLGPLGVGFPAQVAGVPTWLVAGGVGMAPLLFYGEDAVRRGQSALRLFYGGRRAEDLVLLDRIAKLDIPLELATEDGSRGTRGYITDVLAKALERAGESPVIMACGPEPMLRVVAKLARAHALKAFLSLEGQMACGIGACLGCAVPGAKRPFLYTCKDGPVMDLEDLELE